MVDIKVKPFLDLTKGHVRQQILSKIEAGLYDVILLSPPCSTFSRAPWSNRRGPRPVRSFCNPRGFNRLRWSERSKANWGNILADFSFQVCKLVITQHTMLLFENPEDLGAIQHGEFQGQRPASMWQWEAFEQLLLSGAFQSFAFYQQDFGTEYLKPTRLLCKGFPRHEKFAEGSPTFDEQGYYQGPLQRREAKTCLIGLRDGAFKTTGTEQWPSDFCKWIAKSCLQSITSAIASGRVDDAAGTTTADADKLAYETLKPDGWKVLGGHGEPRQCRAPGKIKPFHDGSGLASPGRWDIEQRIWNDNNFWKDLRNKSLDLVLKHCGGDRRLDIACFEMAAKGEAGCSIVKDTL